MEGFDKDWNYVGEQLKVYFHTNGDPAKYVAF